MSVQSEITRLEAAKAAISQAITEKGVTVPNGTMLDAMAPLIAAIEAGGGSEILNSVVLSGELTPAEDISADHILISSSDLPEGVVLYRNLDAAFMLFAPHIALGTNYIAGAVSVPNENIAQHSSSSIAGAIITNTNTVANGRLALGLYDWGLTLHCTSSRILKAGILYKWVLLVPKEV